MSGAMNRHCIPGYYVHSPDGELLCGRSGNNSNIQCSALQAALPCRLAPDINAEETDVMI